ncbi:hypothetical protein AGR4B_Cc90011 [Agrobacterium tumefaciens str. CFBP 5621]|nr:hypothetical protein AGR4B_Cc90011 [Agrobacterium tumefaciens str. CFBP 5621]
MISTPNNGLKRVVKSAVPLANKLVHAVLTGHEQATSGSVQRQDRGHMSATTLRPRSVASNRCPRTLAAGNTRPSRICRLIQYSQG